MYDEQCESSVWLPSIKRGGTASRRSGLVQLQFKGAAKQVINKKRSCGMAVIYFFLRVGNFSIRRNLVWGEGAMCARVRELAPNCHRGRLLLALSSCGDPPKARGAFGVRWTATDGRSGSGTFAIAK